MSTVLIADDSRFMRAYLKQQLLSYDSYDILEASDGKQAIELFKRFQPDLVLLDITMQHIDGIAALKEIMSIDNKATVVMCSSMGTQHNVAKSLRLGASDFIIKPHFNRLINVLTKINNN